MPGTRLLIVADEHDGCAIRLTRAMAGERVAARLMLPWARTIARPDVANAIRLQGSTSSEPRVHPGEQILAPALKRSAMCWLSHHERGDRFPSRSSNVQRRCSWANC